MRYDLKRAWTEALRSGDYVQGHGRLYAEGKYCCLGVLAEVAGLDKDEDIFGQTRYGSDADYFDGYTLSPDALSQLGLTEAQQGQFVRMNDQYGANFEQIAEAIEAFL